MPNFRVVPRVVQAQRWWPPDHPEHKACRLVQECPDEFMAAIVEHMPGVPDLTSQIWVVETNEGYRQVEPGDWIVIDPDLGTLAYNHEAFLTLFSSQEERKFKMRGRLESVMQKRAETLSRFLAWHDRISQDGHTVNEEDYQKVTEPLEAPYLEFRRLLCEVDHNEAELFYTKLALATLIYNTLDTETTSLEARYKEVMEEGQAALSNKYPGREAILQVACEQYPKEELDATATLQKG